MDNVKRTGDEIKDFHRQCAECGQPFVDCRCERCEVCGSVGECECTDDDARWTRYYWQSVEKDMLREIEYNDRFYEDW